MVGQIMSNPSEILFPRFGVGSESNVESSGKTENKLSGGCRHGEAAIACGESSLGGSPDVNDAVQDRD